MTVVAKFLCIEKGETGYSEEYITSKVVLIPVTGNSEENQNFFQATPTGKLEMNMVNQSAAEQFEVGKEYFVDFSTEKIYKEVAENPPKNLTEDDLMNILAKNNKQLLEAVKTQETNKKENCPVNIEEAVRNCGIESGEALMLVKLIQYLRGEKALEEIA